MVVLEDWIVGALCAGIGVSAGLGSSLAGLGWALNH